MDYDQQVAADNRREDTRAQREMLERYLPPSSSALKRGVAAHEAIAKGECPRKFFFKKDLPSKK